MALVRSVAIHSLCLYFTLLAYFFHSPLLARDIAVPPGGNVQAAIDAAAPGDTITLTAGATYAGSYRLTYKVPTTAGEYITIRSSAFAAFQPGNRVSPADRANMALVIAPRGLAAFQTERAANHYRLTGLEIVPTAGDYNYDLIRFGVGDESSSLDIPEHLQADHLYVHGDPAVGSKRGIGANGRSITIRDSYISGFFSTFQDSQAICGWNGPGPMTIVNNYLEAAGENIMFGGQTPTLAGVVPSDITIQGNYLYKPLSWKSTNYIIKNLLELKNGRRVLIESNILENSWGPLQFGQALTFTVRTEYGTAPWAVVQDVTFRYNIIRNAGRVSLFTGYDDQAGNLGVGSNLTLQNNVFENIAERGFAAFGAATLVIDHNTLLMNPGSQMLLAGDIAPTSGLVFTNNIATHGLYGVWGSGAGLGTVALNAYFPGAQFANNALLDAPVNPSSYPAGNLFRTTAEAGFMNLAAGDYRLGSASPFLASGTDGRAIGADVATLMSMTANTVTGRTAASASYQLTVSSASVLAGASLSVTWNASGAASADRIGLYLLAGSSSSPVWLSGPTNGAVSGSFTLSAPSTAGQYEFRYLPGGGSTAAAASGPITVTVPAIPFSVTASPTVVAGQDTSITWTAPASRTPKDWIALYAVGAPASAYLAGGYTGGGASGSLTLTIAVAPGQYEFRYLMNDSLTIAAKSSVISVTAVVPIPPVTNIVVTGPSGNVSPGAPISVRWTASGAVTSRDWIALYPVGAPDSGYGWGSYTRGAASGTLNLTAPTTPGQYEFRYLLNDSFVIGARSAAVAVAPTTVAPGISITAPAAAALGSPLNVNWTAPANHSSRDWIALYPTGGANASFISASYVGTAASGTITVVTPTTPGQYEFRYLLNDSFSLGARSSPISISSSVSSGFTIAASAASANRGGTIQVQWTASANRTTTDWVALYRTGAAPAAYLWGNYTGGRPSGSIQLTLPSTPGQYEFRYLPYDGLVPAAVSSPFTIQ